MLCCPLRMLGGWQRRNSMTLQLWGLWRRNFKSVKPQLKGWRWRETPQLRGVL